MASIRKFVRKSGTRYTAEIRKKLNGTTHTESKTLSSLPALKKWIKHREAELELNGLPSKSSELTLCDLIDQYLNEYKEILPVGRSKHYDFKRLYQDAISKIPCESINSAVLINHVKSRLKAGVQPQTANNDVVWINILLQFGRATADVKYDIAEIRAAKSFLKTAKMIAPSAKRNRIPTPEEHGKLIAYFSNRKRKVQTPMLDILKFAMFSARRQGEITRILWSDNNEKDKTGMVRDLKHPVQKLGNHQRFIYTNEAWEIVQQQAKSGARIFPYNRRTVSSNFTRACKLLEINDLRFHDYRHLATTWLFTQNRKIQEVSQVTLHESWETLKRYTHLSPEIEQQIKEIYQKKRE